MLGVFMGVAFIAVLIIGIFMDKLPKELEDDNRSGNIKNDIGKLLVATVKHLRHVPQLLLIPLTIYSGLEQGYFNAEWSKACPQALINAPFFINFLYLKAAITDF